MTQVSKWMNDYEHVVIELIVGLLSQPIAHFLIKAPNLAQMFISMIQIFSDIGPPEI